MSSDFIMVSFLKHRALLFLVVLLSTASIDASQTDTYTVLDWKDLIPSSWQPPLIQPDPSKHEVHEVNKASLASKLQHQKVKLPGFIKPIVFEQNRVTEFLLVPFLEHHVKQHIHHDANQMVYVSLAEPLTIENPYLPLWIKGEIILESVDTDEGPSGYRIINAVTAEYIY